MGMITMLVSIAFYAICINWREAGKKSKATEYVVKKEEVSEKTQQMDSLKSKGSKLDEGQPISIVQINNYSGKISDWQKLGKVLHNFIFKENNYKLYEYIKGGEEFILNSPQLNYRFSEKLFEWIYYPEDKLYCLKYKTFWHNKNNHAPFFENDRGSEYFVKKGESLGCFVTIFLGSTPVYAPHDGLVEIMLDTTPATMIKGVQIPDNSFVLKIDTNTQTIKTHYGGDLLTENEMPEELIDVEIYNNN